ncbi:MAG: protease inhibitor I42 family protein [Pseudomonas sp.]|uniref:protease inhibitor I42 family protein n=1 Tax=Pseudomonas sp. TaxID=306 RepID=UPI0033987117
MTAARLLLPLGLSLLGACAQHSSSRQTLQVDSQAQCPLQIRTQQTLILVLPSNPTTGFRWQLADAATPLLRSLGPEVYSNPEDVGLVGSAGQSTWRFQAETAGEGRLHLQYRRPWETDLPPAETFDCPIQVR